MAELGILTLLFATVALSGLSFYFYSETNRLRYEIKNLDRQVELLKNGTDFEALSVRYGLRRFRTDKRIGRDELRRYQGPEEELNKQSLMDMKDDMLRELTEQGVFKVVREDVPAKPHIMLRMKVSACDDSQLKGNEQTVEGFMTSHQRPLGTTG